MVRARTSGQRHSRSTGPVTGAGLGVEGSQEVHVPRWGKRWRGQERPGQEEGGDQFGSDIAGRTGGALSREVTQSHLTKLFGVAMRQTDCALRGGKGSANTEGRPIGQLCLNLGAGGWRCGTEG